MSELATLTNTRRRGRQPASAPAPKKKPAAVLSMFADAAPAPAPLLPPPAPMKEKTPDTAPVQEPTPISPVSASPVPPPASNPPVTGDSPAAGIASSTAAVIEPIERTSDGLDLAAELNRVLALSREENHTAIGATAQAPAAESKCIGEPSIAVVHDSRPMIYPPEIAAYLEGVTTGVLASAVFAAGVWLTRAAIAWFNKKATEEDEDE